MKFGRYALVIALIAQTLGALAAGVSLTILHTNDTHGHILPFSYPAMVAAGSDIAKMKYRNDIGGIARRATLVKTIRAEVKSHDGTTWLFDAGDICDGTPFSTEFHGEADVDAMNAIGYDFAVLGNHEFSNTLTELKKLIAMAKYHLLCANAIEKSTGNTIAPPYTIQTIGKLRVGVFGLVTESAQTYQGARDGVTIASEIVTAKQMVDILRKKADFIIMVSHIGVDNDHEVARRVPGIDVIVGGHSHTRLPIGEFEWASDEIRSDWVNGTVIVQDHQWGAELGRLDLVIDKARDGKWHVIRYRERLIPITHEIAEDESVRAVVERYWKPVSAKYEEVVGRATGDFSSHGDDDAEYNFVTDVVREAAGTEFDMENYGGVRAPIVKGNITKADLVSLDPFGNTIVTFKVTGRDLRKLLETVQPAVSGIRYRIVEGKLAEATINGKPIEDEREYFGATNSWMAAHELKSFNGTDTKKSRLDAVIAYVRNKHEISPSYDGRRVMINTATKD